jgi:polyferredoxin
MVLELASGVSLVIDIWIVSTLAIIALWCCWLCRSGPMKAAASSDRSGDSKIKTGNARPVQNAQE